MKGESKRMNRVAAVIIILLALMLPGCAEAQTEPALIFDESVSADLHALAKETWNQFLATFQARQSCFGDVHLHAAKTHPGSRATYDPQTATVTVRVPATAALLKSALVHEWAHHIEFQCEAQQELRKDFLVAQRFLPDTPWRTGETPAAALAAGWADIPSEHYAEATIELVLGRRQIPTGVQISAEAVNVIRLWAGGENN